MSSYKFNIVVCASGGGGNFQAIIDAQIQLGVVITRLIVDRPCGAIGRAEKNNIPFIQLKSGDLESELLSAIPLDTSLIVLAGFMPILPALVCDEWKYKIINTHPSLLPKYGGRGMYGVKVQEAVILAQEKEAGCTIHYVTAEIDGGEIILQKSIPIVHGETPWNLGGRVFMEENSLLIEAIKLIKEKYER